MNNSVTERYCVAPETIPIYEMEFEDNDSIEKTSKLNPKSMRFNSPIHHEMTSSVDVNNLL